MNVAEYGLVENGWTERTAFPDEAKKSPELQLFTVQVQAEFAEQIAGQTKNGFCTVTVVELLT